MLTGEYSFITITRFLCNPTKDVDMRKWAAEGLAYLTLDADVKEDLVEDTDALKSLFDLAQVSFNVIFLACNHCIFLICIVSFYFEVSVICFSNRLIINKQTD